MRLRSHTKLLEAQRKEQHSSDTYEFNKSEEEQQKNLDQKLDKEIDEHDKREEQQQSSDAYEFDKPEEEQQTNIEDQKLDKEEDEHDKREEQQSSDAYEFDKPEEEQQTNLEDQKLDEEEDEHKDEDLTKDEIMKPLTPQKLAEFEKAQNKTGLVYLSRIPPFMKPAKIKHLLSQFGEIGRVYLAPEDPKIKARRIKYRGNKKQNYTEGWVEFMDKKVAKNVAAALNSQPIGGNKRNFYHDDLWNIKYLPKFKWNNLTETIVNENTERRHRLQAEISQSRREIKDYIKKVEKSKMIRSIEQKKAKKHMLVGN